MLEPVSAPAPAKVNLLIEILAKRFDQYHEIRTVLQTLELSDTVTVRRRHPHAPCVTASGPFSAGTPVDESNLAWRAAELLARRTGNTVDPIAIDLEKHIPPAGGLGGGASDAATVLRLLQRAWQNVTSHDLEAVAAAVGSDEPFFLHGGTALASGRGEHVQPLEPLPAHAIVLFVPPFTLERKTARMFEAIAATGFDDGTATAVFCEASPRRITSSDIHNAFERVAFDIFDGLADLHADLQRRIDDRVRLAGAGPTLFWIGPAEHGAAIAERASGSPCNVILTATAPGLWKP